MVSSKPLHHDDGIETEHKSEPAYSDHMAYENDKRHARAVFVCV